jgi:hypothetical protein
LVCPHVDFAVARYNTDGSLDATFDGNGTVTTDFRGVALGAASNRALSTTSLWPDTRFVGARHGQGPPLSARSKNTAKGEKSGWVKAATFHKPIAKWSEFIQLS